MPMRIEAAEYALMDVFSDRFVFRIPAYQRPYSWTTEQASELLEDIVNALEDDSRGDDSAYFLGAIVLAKEEGNPVADVIDGQQRLTTLTILLVALAALTDSEKKRADIRQFILQEGNDLKKTKTVFRLTLRQRDAEFFRRYVQTPRGIEDLLLLDSSKLSDPAANMQANAKLFLKRLEELPPTKRADLALFLTTRCFLVAVSTQSPDSAFKIFAVLNDRGLDLTHADILKSELVGAVPSAEHEKCTQAWETAEELLGLDAFADLFAHIRMMYAKTKQRESLIKEFRNHVTSAVPDPVRFIGEVLSPYAEIYRQILHADWKSAFRVAEINRELGWLSRIDNSDWVPPAIRYLHRHAQDPDAICEFLTRLERLAASMYIRRVNVNGRLERYAKLLGEIDAMSGGGLVSMNLSAEERRATVYQLSGELYLERRTRNYVLLRLDEALSGGGASYDYPLISVEHVLPQNPKPSSQWTRAFNEEERARWTHRLANLVLLPRARNSAAGNLEFEDKKKKYFADGKGASPFVITTQVLAAKEWTPYILERRQETLMKELMRLWRLDD